MDSTFLALHMWYAQTWTWQKSEVCLLPKNTQLNPPLIWNFAHRKHVGVGRKEMEKPNQPWSINGGVILKKHCASSNNVYTST